VKKTLNIDVASDITHHIRAQAVGSDERIGINN
jgi:hypothetical protein